MKMQKTKLRHRVLALALALMLCVSMLNLTAFATEGAVDSEQPSASEGEVLTNPEPESVVAPEQPVEPEQKPDPVPEAPAGDTPAEKPAEDTPTEKPAEGAPTEKPAEGAPTEKPAEEAKVTETTEEVVEGAETTVEPVRQQKAAKGNGNGNGNQGGNTPGTSYLNGIEGQTGKDTKYNKAGWSTWNNVIFLGGANADSTDEEVSAWHIVIKPLPETNPASAIKSMVITFEGGTYTWDGRLSDNGSGNNIGLMLVAPGSWGKITYGSITGTDRTFWPFTISGYFAATGTTPPTTEPDPTPDTDPIVINVEKKWQASGDATLPKELPEVTVELLKGGKSLDERQFLTLRASTEWKGTFTDLTPGDDYSVKEVDETDGKITLDGKTYTVSYDGYTITNTLQPTIPAETKTVVEFTKTVDGKTPTEDFQFDIYQGGTLKKANAFAASADHGTYTVKFTPKLDAGEYTIKEVLTDDQTANYLDGKTLTFSVDEQGIATFPEENAIFANQTKTSVTVTKEWKVSEGTTLPSSVKVQLYQNDKAYGTRAALTANVEWTHTWNELPAKDDEGTPYSYSVKEVDETDGKITLDGKTYTVSYNGYTITNTLLKDEGGDEGETETVVEFTKTVDGKTPAENFQFDIYQGIERTHENAFTASADHGTYTAKFTPKLDAGVYTIKEVLTDDQKAKYLDGKTLTFSVDEQGIATFPEENAIFANQTKTSVTVTKAWAGNALPTSRPNVPVQLYCNNAIEGDVVTLNAENNWTHTWGNLPMTDEAGTVSYVYTVKEVGESLGSITLSDGLKYDVDYSGNAESGYKITNTRNTEPEQPTDPVTPPSNPRTLTVNKLWVGDEDAGVRPDSIQVQLYLSGAAYGSPVTLSAANGWTFTWSGLPAAGTPTVEELNIPEGYEAATSISGSNVTITNTYTDEEIEDPDVPLGPGPGEPTPTPTPAPSEKPTPGPSATPDPDEDIEDPDVPLGPGPEDPDDPDGPDEEIPDENVPLGTPKPVEPSEPDDGEEIPDEEVPMAKTPKTGDDSGIWMTLALISAAGLVFLGISRRKKGENVR